MKTIQMNQAQYDALYQEMETFIEAHNEAVDRDDATFREVVDLKILVSAFNAILGNPLEMDNIPSPNIFQLDELQHHALRKIYECCKIALKMKEDKHVQTVKSALEQFVGDSLLTASVGQN